MEGDGEHSFDPDPVEVGIARRDPSAGSRWAMPILFVRVDINSYSAPRASCGAARRRHPRHRSCLRGTSASSLAAGVSRGGLHRSCDAAWHSWSPPLGKEPWNTEMSDDFLLKQLEYRRPNSRHGSGVPTGSVGASLYYRTRSAMLRFWFRFDGVCGYLPLTAVPYTLDLSALQHCEWAPDRIKGGIDRAICQRGNTWRF
jgi:hypothetical protein